MKSKNQRMAEIAGLSPVIPVLRFDSVDDAVSTCHALVDGGLPVLEITMRTKVAIECIEAVVRQVDGAVVGAGTVLSRAMMNDCHAAGAEFLVSPGATQELLEHNRKIDIPLLPGIATPSEAMGMIAENLEMVKFFPAERAGGASYLKDLGAVFPGLKICPTGGLTAANAQTYLDLFNVPCVGGSWVAPADLIAEKDWAGITALAAEASLLNNVEL